MIRSGVRRGERRYSIPVRQNLHPKRQRQLGKEDGYNGSP
jgi:hypothetical protein